MTDQIGVAAAEQYPVKGRLDPSTKGSLPASPPATSPEGEAHRATAEATKPGRSCPDCEGLGRVEIPVLSVSRGRRDDSRVIGSRWDLCMTCLGRRVVEEEPQTKG